MPLLSAQLFRSTVLLLVTVTFFAFRSAPVWGEEREDTHRALAEIEREIARIQEEITQSELLRKAAQERLESLHPGQPLLKPQGETVRAEVDFEKEIFPILRDNCFRCHGPEKQKAGLRLDAEECVLKGGKTGPAVLPGNGEESLLFKRVAGIGDAEQMPPTDPKLTAGQIALIRAWIDQGAKWPDSVGVQVSSTRHWAYEPPVRPPLPTVNAPDWVRNPIDAFVLARIENEGFAPSREAPKEMLLRRLSLDLTGLPPSVRDLDEFLADTGPDAYEKAVDRLLASPHYGEHWARQWLDLARYADTNGYEKDLVRSMWPWRDWVVAALNCNMPFDRFTVEQIAGDLLPGATRDQIIATGFHRNTLLNDEGGIDPEEFRVVAVKDRVDTTAAAWLGSTLFCAQCHDHKYDPFTNKEYYQFYAFFNSTSDMGVGQDPVLKLPTPEQEAEAKRLETEIASLEPIMNTQTPELDRAQMEWEQSLHDDPDQWTVLLPVRFSSTEGSLLTQLEDHSLLAVGDNPDNDVYRVSARIPFSGVTALRLEALTHPILTQGGPGRGPMAGFLLGEVKAEITPSVPAGQTSPLLLNASPTDLSAGRILIAQPTSVIEGATLTLTLSHNSGSGNNLGRFRLAVTRVEEPFRRQHLPPEIEAVLAVSRELRDATQASRLAAHFRSITPLLADQRGRLAEAKEALSKMGIPSTMVMRELPAPRPSHILERGNFLTPGEEVQPDVPRVFPPLPEGSPKNRLTLAQWLVDRKNPLTARVLVNRIWSGYFGHGLVKTGEDFGSQGDKPTHPELLDWLAVEVMDVGWNLKALHKLIVTSATYRQDSHATPQIIERDPHNVLYARGARYRLEAESLRDNALAISGLLNPQIGGPSVFPPQPEGIWDNSFTIHDTKVRWETAQDAQRYRRGLYTFLRRTALYPTYLMFDGATRDVCIVERARSNTPVQALATLNDPVFVEAAGGLARRILAEGGGTTYERLVFAFRTCLARPPTPKEVEIQAALYHLSLDRFQDQREAAEELIRSARQTAEGFVPAELAAWCVVSNVLLNLDETLTKG